MKAWYINSPGSIDNLKWGEVADISAGDGELLIKVNSTALNPVDYKVIVSGNASWDYPHIPGVDFTQATSVLCAGKTAYQAIIQKLNHEHKETILIHAGAGGVGGFAIQLAKELGLKVFTTASSINHSWIKSLGADGAIDYHTEDVTQRILEETNQEGVDLIFNTVSGKTVTEDLNRLAFSGQLAYIAGAPDLSTVEPSLYHHLSMKSH